MLRISRFSHPHSWLVDPIKTLKYLGIFNVFELIRCMLSKAWCQQNYFRSTVHIYKHIKILEKFIYVCVCVCIYETNIPEQTIILLSHHLPFRRKMAAAKLQKLMQHFSSYEEEIVASTQEKKKNRVNAQRTKSKSSSILWTLHLTAPYVHSR